MEYIALGCMTGTSLDGIDCSLIKSDGISEVKEISNNFTPYSSSIKKELLKICLLYTSPSQRDGLLTRMPSSA